MSGKKMSNLEFMHSRQKKEPRVAIIHYWWLTNRGGEAVVSELLEIFPNADLFCHVLDRNIVKNTLGSHFRGNIKTTFIANFPGSQKHYQKYLPLMPFALENLDLSEYDIIISSESGPAKGVITRPDALHLCYCHSPMRYIWDMYPNYLKQLNPIARTIFLFVSNWLRIWDRASADRVDHFVANSNFVASRIKKYYRRDSTVIFPPVDVQKFTHDRTREDFYLLLGQLVPYKRPEIAVQAFNELNLPLVVIGEGEMLDQIRRLAGPKIEVVGRQDYAFVKDHLERCRALVFPGIEDFGIVPVEAMAAGAPVIAFRRGGVLDSVIDRQTGVFFDEQTPEALIDAVKLVECGKINFDRNVLKAHSLKFDRVVFKENILSVIGQLVGQRK